MSYASRLSAFEDAARAWDNMMPDDDCDEAELDACPCCDADYDPACEPDYVDEGPCGGYATNHGCDVCMAYGCIEDGKANCRCVACGKQHNGDEEDGRCVPCLNFGWAAHEQLMGAS